MHDYLILYISETYITGYQIIAKPMSSGEISQTANNCHSKSIHSVITMDNLVSKTLSGIEVIAPSQCNSEYNNKLHLYFIIIIFEIILIAYWKTIEIYDKNCSYLFLSL